MDGDRNYFDLIERAKEYLEKEKKTRAWLARHAGVSAPTLTRILNKPEDFIPLKPTSKASKVFEAIAKLCDIESPYPIEEYDPSGDIQSRDPARRFFGYLNLKNHQARRAGSALATIMVCDDLFTRVLFAPSEWVTRACHNLLHTLVKASDSESFSDVPTKVLKETTRRVRRLLDLGLKALPDDAGSQDVLRPKWTLQGRLRAHAGYTLCRVGCLLGEGEIIEDGLELLCKAARGESLPKNDVWHNARRAFDDCLRSIDEGDLGFPLERKTVENLSAKLANAAINTEAPEALALDLEESRRPHLERHWNALSEREGGGFVVLKRAAASALLVATMLGLALESGDDAFYRNGVATSEMCSGDDAW